MMPAPSTTDCDRGQFLSGDWNGRRRPFRPPWAVDEALFTQRCSSCGDCVQACPERILTRGRGRYPQVDFGLGECTFCAACATACRSGALAPDDGRAPWSLSAEIADHCVALGGVECRSCGDYCPERAIRFRPRVGGVARPALEATLCTGCGACVRPCPVGAIAIVRPPPSDAIRHDRQGTPQ